MRSHSKPTAAAGLKRQEQLITNLRQSATDAPPGPARRAVACRLHRRRCRSGRLTDFGTEKVASKKNTAARRSFSACMISWVPALGSRFRLGREQDCDPVGDLGVVAAEVARRPRADSQESLWAFDLVGATGIEPVTSRL
jgi:hypothetical protein